VTLSKGTPSQFPRRARIRYLRDTGLSTRRIRRSVRPPPRVSQWVGQDVILQRVVNPERRLAIGAQVNNLPHSYVSRITIATPCAAVCVMESAILRTPSSSAIFAAWP
jgi:hypothetical protein